MATLLGNINRAVLIGLALMLAVILGFHGAAIEADTKVWAGWLIRAAHAWAGVLWIGLLYYFNFVQIPTMPRVPAELKPAVSKYIAPEALFWFRWSALATLILGLGVPGLSGYPLGNPLTFQPGYALIGTGMYLGIIMAANVWMIIWPAQKIALGIVDADADAKAAAARKAMMGSRINFILSFPMLYCMVTQQSGL
ncbi:MAG: urate hydroxylase PuuD [Polymorphobacter sp.]|uniref:urate hydroxylase PuuD n=1 Tax=Polymorphobacter sp. TaxID=1909290 RepID=UPI003A8C2786